MGGASSKNDVNNTIKQLVEVITNSVQACSTNGRNITNITVKSDCEYGDILITDNKFEQKAALDLKCVSDVSTNTNVKQDLQTMVKQQAEAIAQQFQLGGADAENITNQLLDISTSIQNKYSNTVNANLDNIVGVNVDRTNCSSGNVIVSENTFSQVVDITLSAIQKVDSINIATQKVINTIDQKATAKVEPFFGGSILLSIACMAFIGLFIWKGIDILTDWRKVVGIIGIVAIFVGIYFGIAYWRKWPPFKSDKKPDKKSDKKPDKTKDDVKFKRLDNINLMKGKSQIKDQTNIENYGLYDTQLKCENKCGSDDKCKAYTWFSAGAWKDRCYGMYSDDYVQSAQDDRYSGYKIL